MARTITKDIEQLDRTQALVQGGAEELIAKSESKVLTRLVQKSRDGKLNDRDAAVGIAVIQELQDLRAAVRREVTRGIDVGQRITS